MAPRAIWKGYLKIADLVCPVALYTAASTSDRIAFHILNRLTGHRVRRRFIDSNTGKPVASEEQVKGYQTGSDDSIILDSDEISSAIPESDKTLTVSAFIACADIDDVYFDKPYYLTPSDTSATESYELIREALRSKAVSALAQTVLFRRVRTVLIHADDLGLIATTLNFDYEIRSVKEAFADIPKLQINPEMLELAEHIIQVKAGEFNPADYDDHYDVALAQLIKAKIEGRKITPPKPAKQDKIINLMTALRESAKLKQTKPSDKDKKRSPQPRKAS